MTKSSSPPVGKASSSKKNSKRSETQKTPHNFWHERYEAAQELGQLTGTRRRGADLGFSSLFGLLYGEPTREQIQEAVQKDPAKAIAITNAWQKLAKLDQELLSAQAQALKGLREKRTDLFFDPFARFGDILLEDPTIREALRGLYHQRWTDPLAKKCLDEFGKAFASKVSGRNQKGAPSEAEQAEAEEIETAYRALCEIGREIKQKWKASRCRNSQQRRNLLVKDKDFDLTYEKAAEVEDELLGTEPSEWALVRTAQHMDCPKERVRRLVLEAKSTRAVIV